jgi:hypothetical protein
MKPFDIDAHIFKEGDYFKCEFTDVYTEVHTNVTHCFEGLLSTEIKPNGNVILFDTFWGLKRFGQQSRCFTLDNVGTLIDIEFIGNINDYSPTPISFAESKYFDEEDILYLHEQHACSSSCKYYYVRLGAARSKYNMLQEIDNKMYQYESEIKSLNSKIQSLQLQRLALIGCNTNEELNKIWI